MRNVVSMALKDLRLLWRDKFGLFWVLAFPLLFAVFFGSIFSGGGNGGSATMDIAVVDQDSTEASQLFIESLAESEALEIHQISLAEAENKVRRGKLVAYIIIKEGFGETPPAFFGGENMLRIGIDPSRRAEAGYLKGIIAQKSFEQYQDIFSNPERASREMREAMVDIDSSSGLAPESRAVLKNLFSSLDQYFQLNDTALQPGGSFGQEVETEPVQRESSGISPVSAFEITFPSAIMWALLGCAASFGISIVKERRAGTYLRLRLAPVSRAQVLAGKGLACWLACMFVTIALLIFGRLVFGVRIDNLTMLVPAVFCCSVCFVGIMMAMSVLGKTEESVAGAGWAILMVMAMLGGGMVPLVAMPGWMKTASNLSPIKWGIISLEGAIWRDFSASEMLLPAGILLGVGLVFFLFGVFRFSRYDL
jgi:ABC-2 type transport system permease protein